MATSRQFLDYVLEQLSGLEQVRVRPMMGEYLCCTSATATPRGCATTG